MWILTLDVSLTRFTNRNMESDDTSQHRLSIHHGVSSYLSLHPTSPILPLGLPLRSKPSLSHPLIPRIHFILLETCTTAAISITFIWASGHKGIPGNEKSDKAAEDATHQSTTLKSSLQSNSDLFFHKKIHKPALVCPLENRKDKWKQTGST